MYKTVAFRSSGVGQLEELAGLPADSIANLTLLVYGIAILLTLLFQGLNARYYFARVQLLADYLRETPDWVVDLQKINVEANR